MDVRALYNGGMPLISTRRLRTFGFALILVGIGAVGPASRQAGLSAAQAGATANEPNVQLQLMTGTDRRVVTLEEMKKLIVPATLKVYNPSYQRKITYKGFWMDDLLRTFHFPTGKDAQLVFLCRDGYTVLLSNSWIGKRKWMLAFGEEPGPWSLLDEGAQKVSPGPWYLVGSKKETFGDFPWPYAVVGIRSLDNW
jgi:hypothetical protein